MTQTEKHHLTVLIADDEIEFASTLVARLQLRKFRANMTNSGKATLAAIEQEQPDVLVLDLKMPDLNGPEIWEQLAGVRPDVPVIFFTGYAERDVRSRLPVHARALYLQKPFTYHTMLAAVGQALTTT